MCLVHIQYLNVAETWITLRILNTTFCVLIDLIYYLLSVTESKKPNYDDKLMGGTGEDKITHSFIILSSK